MLNYHPLKEFEQVELWGHRHHWNQNQAYAKCCLQKDPHPRIIAIKIIHYSPLLFSLMYLINPFDCVYLWSDFSFIRQKKPCMGSLQVLWLASMCGWLKLWPDFGQFDYNYSNLSFRSICTVLFATAQKINHKMEYQNDYRMIARYRNLHGI